MTTAGLNLLDIHRAATDLDGVDPVEIVRWAHSQLGDDLVVTASFEDAALVHVVATAVPGIEIALIDTGYLFAETLWYAERLRSLLDLNLRVVRPVVGPADVDRWEHDTTGCCGVRKVEPLDRTLAGRAGWITGLRRVDGPTRAGTPVVSYDAGRGIVKVNPLVAWSDDDLDHHHLVHDLPRNPLTERGYPSIGCWPCTRPVQPGDDRRAGRWAGSDKTECGLHL
jgi:phosphoadenosine phosphosulfate reductase